MRKEPFNEKHEPHKMKLIMNKGMYVETLIMKHGDGTYIIQPNMFRDIRDGFVKAKIDIVYMDLRVAKGIEEFLKKNRGNLNEKRTSRSTL